MNGWNDNSLSDAIEQCAHHLENFQDEGILIGFENAKRKIEAWIKNFELFMNDPELLAILIKHIQFISDQDVMHQCHSFEKDHIDFHGRDIYYTCLGAETESSSRIMRQINNQPHFTPSIGVLLKKIQHEQIKNPAIVFIDDFLNSGGQFSSILESWFDNGSNISQKSETPASEFNRRCPLERCQIELLQSCYLHFIYLNGMAKGLEKAKQTLKKIGMNGDVHILNTYSDDEGLFGDRDDISHIRSRLSVPLSQKSIFHDMPADRISVLLEMCEKIGHALLKTNKPGWPEDRVRHRILGYGNSSKLFISQANIPTCTLTCLWLGGHIEIDGKPVKWAPLIPRIEKKIAGTENRDDEKHEGISTCYPKYPPDGFPDLSRISLDYRDSASPPFDMTVFMATPQPFPYLPSDQWRDVTMRHADHFKADILEYLGLTAETPHIFVKELDPKFYKYFNNTVVFHLNGRKIPLKIKSIVITTFENLISFVGVRFQFDKPGVNMKDALEISYHLPINKISGKTDDPVLHIRNSSLTMLFHWVISVAEFQKPVDFPMVESCCFSLKRQERFNAFTFIREKSGLFDERHKKELDIALHILGGFSRPVESVLTKAVDFKTIKLDNQAVICLSHKGVGLLCSGNVNANTSYLSDHFHWRYFLLYLFVMHLPELKRKIRLHAIEADHADAAKKWVKRFDHFPFEDSCQKKHMNGFPDALVKMMTTVTATIPRRIENIDQISPSTSGGGLGWSKFDCQR